jgi:hypothetical protein
MNIARCAVAVLLALAASRAGAQSRDWIALPLGAAQDMTLEASGDRDTRIPATVLAAPGKGAPASLVVRLVDVVAKDGRGARLAQAFGVAWAAAGDGRDAAIVVKVPRAADVNPGTYTLLLRVSPDPDDPRLPAQRVAVTLNVAAPALSIEPVLVGQVLGLPPFESDRTLDGSLRITETSRRAGARALRVTFLPDAPAAGLPVAGVLAAPASAPDIGSDQALALPIAASGAFPVGRSSGRIELRSPDLSVPVATTYEVRVARSTTWMIPVILGGFLAGYLVRVRLARARARNAALLLASQAIASIDERLAAIADADFQHRAAAIREALVGAAAARVPTNLPAATAQARSDLDAALKALEERLAPLRQQAAALQTFAGRTWNAPEPIARALAALQEQLDALVRLLARDDATATARALATTIVERLAGVVNAARSCGAAAARRMEEIVGCALPLADADGALLARSAAALARQYPADAPDVAQASLEEATAALSEYAAASSVAAKVLAALADQAASFVDRAATRLRPGFAQVDLELGPLKARAWTLLDRAALLDGLHAMPDDLRSGLATLHDDCVAALRRVAGRSWSAAVETPIEQGSWDKAVEALRALASARFLGGPQAPAEAAPPGPGTAFAKPLPLPDGMPAAAPSTIQFAPVMLTGSSAEQARLQHAGAVASAAQSLLLAVLFLLANVVLYGESWVGTGKEMMTLFLLAFGLDLSADNVLAALKKA